MQIASSDFTPFSTGLPGLDKMLLGLIPGDNVVWQVDNVDDYLPFVQAFWEESKRRGRRLVYFRFARHKELVPEDGGGQVYRLRPEEGFERFMAQILDVIEKVGPGGCYVFDWLSDLAADWYSDRMLGSFFMITCPYLYELNTIAYFGLRKHQHSFHATEAIHRTAQVILDVYCQGEEFYLHPQKVYERYSPTLYLLHRQEGADFKPVTSSGVITDILAHMPQPWLDFTIHRPGVWVRTFLQAQATLTALRQGRRSPAEAEAFFERILKMVVTRDERFVHLAKKYFEPNDLILIMQRMIGTGLIGGKSLGMLLARAILRKANPRWAQRLEGHDSFFIGSDVFYSFLVENGCWWLRRKIKDPAACQELAEEARQKILAGAFPHFIQDQFMQMLEYYGQAPIIVRSSSLLEDNYGNAFSGKYESVFCANQGTPAERLGAFMAAVRKVYASSMSAEGLAYRLHYGLMDRDEQMAILVQRVSGELYGDAYFPQMAGVAFSFNPYVWHEDIAPEAGMLRLVLGLGTRAVDRTDDDYTRLVALNDPLRRPDTKSDKVRQHSQHRVDVLDLKANRLVARDLEAVTPTLPASVLELVSERDEERHRPGETEAQTPRVLTFDTLLGQTEFAADMRELLQTLQAAYDHPVDVEFTANFFPDGHCRINVLQCRPFQVKIKGETSRVGFPEAVPPAHVVLESAGPVIGHSLAMTMDRVIYVAPAAYSRLSMSQRYSVARTIGRLTHLEPKGSQGHLMLIGPGRWGTSMPSLGIPVSFAEIDRVSVIIEMALMHEGLVPDVSLGTHFFNDLVEADMLYLAIAPGRAGHQINEELLRSQPNRLAQLLPTAASLSAALWVIDSCGLPAGQTLQLNVDSMKQRALCYLAQPEAAVEPARP